MSETQLISNDEVMFREAPEKAKDPAFWNPLRLALAGEFFYDAETMDQWFIDPPKGMFDAAISRAIHVRVEEDTVQWARRFMKGKHNDDRWFKDMVDEVESSSAFARVVNLLCHSLQTNEVTVEHKASMLAEVMATVSLGCWILASETFGNQQRAERMAEFSDKSKSTALWAVMRHCDPGPLSDHGEELFTSGGYFTAAEFLETLDLIRENRYSEEEFADYKRTVIDKRQAA